MLMKFLTPLSNGLESALNLFSEKAGGNMSTTSQFLLGVFELDESGKILYSSFEAPDGAIGRDASLDGSDFFKDVARFSNVDDFQERFDAFRCGEGRTTSFEYTCHYPGTTHNVRIVMARLMTDSTPASYLLHFRRP